MSISIPPITKHVAESYDNYILQQTNLEGQTDICEKCVHQDGCKDRETFHKNHHGFNPECHITFCNGYERQQTNADRIRSMNDYDLADWLAAVLDYCENKRPEDYCLPGCPLYKCCNDQPSDNIEDWLKAPVEEEQT